MNHEVALLLILKWFAVPMLILALTVYLSWVRWFESGWIVALFAVIALLSMTVWRRATYRLLPSLRTVDLRGLDAQLGRRLKFQFVLTVGLSLATMFAALLCVVFFPAARTGSGIYTVFAVMVWASIVQTGAINVLAHHLLRRTIIANDR